MKVGLLITTYNRPEYLKQCLGSLERTELGGVEVLIVDDCTTDRETIEILNSTKYNTLRKTENKRIVDSLLTGFNQLFSQGCEVVMNLDSDAIVRNDFIAVLTDLHNRFPDTIVTGFNCLTRQRNGDERHEIVEQHSEYSLKKTVGGVNMMFNRKVYDSIVRPSLESTLSRGNWDHVTCLNLQKADKLVVCATPSVVQHIGIHSSMGHTGAEVPDVADDFQSLALPDVTLVVIDCVDLQRTTKAVNESVKNIKFGDVKILSSIDGVGVTKIGKLKSIQDYSRFIIRELHRYIHTDYCLIVQYDGYVKNHLAWSDEFLDYDYIGAKWWYKDGSNVGNGGFSLRSRKLLKMTADDSVFTVTHPEDDLICRKHRKHFESRGIKFAPDEVADIFSIEGRGNDRKQYNGSFGFHGSYVIFGEAKTEVLQTKSKHIIVNQFQGLGDIIFMMSIIERWLDKGYTVTWPVVDDYMTIGKHFPRVNFTLKEDTKINYHSKTFVQSGGVAIVPFYWAHVITGVHYTDCMKSKYILLNGDWKKWKGFKLTRDTEAEDTLYYSVLGLKDGERYCLTNTRFRTDQTGSVKVSPPDGMRVIEMKNIEGYTMFDWSKVIENAAEIHTVGTSINYLIEYLDCKASSIHLYIRRPDEKDFKNYDYILTDKYNYIFHQ